MQISYSWIKKYIDIEFKPEELGEILTDLGLEVEGIKTFEKIPGNLEGLVVGEIKSVKNHPNADKLTLTEVDVNNGAFLNIICGAPNVSVGQKVVVAQPGTTIYPVNEKPFKIKKAKIRGVESFGMLCAEDEIGIGEGHDGIIELPGEYEIGKELSLYIKNYVDHVYEIGLTPNRADAMSHIGVAQDIYAYCSYHLPEKKLELKLPELNDIAKERVGRPFNVVIENDEKCYRYTGLSIEGVKVSSSPDWLQNALLSIGLRPINNIVDITNYVLWEYGQALHAFDADNINGDNVIVKTMEQGASFITLDGDERKLDADDLIICDSKGGMCIAGVYGGLNSGVTDSTKNIFLESAYFEASTVRRSSQRHGLRTDAAVRFEKGADADVTIKALKRAASLIKELAGGEVTSDIIDNYPREIKNNLIDFNLDYLDKMAGQSIESANVKCILEGLNMNVAIKNDRQWQVEVPKAKVDVTRPADLVEEILRVYGFNNIEIKPQMNISLGQEDCYDKWRVNNEISSMLISKGLCEAQNNSLVNSLYWEKTGLNIQEHNVVDIINYSSRDLDVLRNDLLFSALNTVSHNLNRRNRDLKFFEFGKAYVKDQKYSEAEYLSLFLVGNKEKESWRAKEQMVDSFYLRKLVEAVLFKLDIDFEFSPGSEGFEEGFEYCIGEDIIVCGGLVKDEKLNIFDIKEPVYYAQINMGVLFKKLGIKPIYYKALNKYPSIRRDLSLLLKNGISFADIKSISFKQEKKLLTSVALFDVYEGKGIEKGMKSYAVSFVFENEHKTMKDKEVDSVMNKIMKALEKDLEAKLR